MAVEEEAKKVEGLIQTSGSSKCPQSETGRKKNGRNFPSWKFVCWGQERTKTQKRPYREKGKRGTKFRLGTFPWEQGQMSQRKGTVEKS